MAEETAANVGNEGSVAEVETKANDTVDVNNDGGDAGNSTKVDETSNGEEKSSQELGEVKLDYKAIKLPDGVTVSDEDLKAFSEMTEKFGFKSQEGLQNFVDWALQTAADEKAKSTEADKQKAEADKKEWEEIKSGWKTSLEGDADFGKEYDLNMKRANDAISQFGGSELVDYLNGLDSMGHPAILKTFARIGKEFEDARLVTGTKTAPKNDRPRDRYNQPMLIYNN